MNISPGLARLDYACDGRRPARVAPCYTQIRARQKNCERIVKLFWDYLTSHWHRQALGACGFDSTEVICVRRRGTIHIFLLGVLQINHFIVDTSYVVC